MSHADRSLPADDALAVAPEHHHLLFENEAVRVLRTSLARGDTTPVHSHVWPAALYVQEWSDVVQRDPSGVIMVDTRDMDERPRPGTSFWTAPVPSHSLTNVGARDLVIIAVEQKQAT